MIGQLKTETKLNEILAIRALQALLEVKRCWVTIDTIDRQLKIAKTIIDKGTDYVLAVKGNQKNAIYNH